MLFSITMHLIQGPHCCVKALSFVQGLFLGDWLILWENSVKALLSNSKKRNCLKRQSNCFICIYDVFRSIAAIFEEMCLQILHLSNMACKFQFALFLSMGQKLGQERVSCFLSMNKHHKGLHVLKSDMQQTLYGLIVGRILTATWSRRRMAWLFPEPQ